MTRELSLNNPMGLKQSDDHFQGEVRPSSDPIFKQFISMVEGVRAGGKVLMTYFNDYGLTTIVDIITRWAPPTENNTAAYIEDVAQRTGYSADEELDLNNPDVLQKLLAAIIFHENGEEVDSAAISSAVTLTYA